MTGTDRNDEVLGKISSYVDANKTRLVAELQAFLRQPSISTEDIGMGECAEMLRDTLTKLGLEARVERLSGAFPAVFGKSQPVPGAPTLLIYGHYDVQSPDPVNLWKYEPFSAQIADGKVWARGATDDKGNMWANIKAVETVMAVLGRIPINLYILFEGEEEIGSPNLERYIQLLACETQADVTIICDRGIHESGRPQMYLGNKGIFNVEITAKRAKRDVHSGHAPLIPNAARDLVRLLTSMFGDDGKFTIPGYYAGCGLEDGDAELLESIPFDPAEFRKNYGIDRALVEGTAIEMLTELLYTPTVNISGIKTGWAGERSKTIIPAEAWVRLDCRVSPGQTVERQKASIADFIKRSPYGPFEFVMKGQNEPIKAPPGHWTVRAAMAAAEKAYGQQPVVWPLLDGSGPMNLFPKHLGGPTFIIGLGAPFMTANTHAPNENIGIKEYLEGIKMMALLINSYATAER